MLAMRSYGITHPGVRRPSNQDYFDSDDALQLYIVADGMGGHTAGEVASQLATRRVHDLVADEVTATEVPDLPDILVRAFLGAHAAIVGAVSDDLSLLGMGTTIIAAILRRNRLTIAHLGDCRAYRLRGGQLRLLTEDHSWVGDQIKAGVLTEQQARTHPLRNVVTRALGGYRDLDDSRLEVEITEVRVHLGDTFLLCSDGLTAMLADEDIGRELHAERPLREMGGNMVDDANNRGGEDNITLVLLRAEDIPEEELTRRRNPALLYQLHAKVSSPPERISIVT